MIRTIDKLGRLARRVIKYRPVRQRSLPLRHIQHHHQHHQLSNLQHSLFYRSIVMSSTTTNTIAELQQQCAALLQQQQQQQQQPRPDNVVFTNALRFDLNGEQIKALNQSLMAYSRAVYDRIASVPPGEETYANTIGELAKAEYFESTITSMIDFPAHVSTDESVREVSNAQSTEWSKFAVEQAMREDVYHVIKRYADMKPTVFEHPEDQRLLERVMRDYQRQGLHLSTEKRTRVQAIDAELASLGNEFQRNLGEDKTTLLFTADELTGLPADVLKRLKKTDDDDDGGGEKYVVSLKYPDYFPAMKYCSVASTRQRLEEAFNKRCLVENTRIMETLVRLRAERAHLLGYPTHADFVLEVRMGKSVANVMKFLNDLNETLEPLAVADRNALLQLKEEEAKANGVAFDGTLNVYDMNYYQRMREEKEFGVDHEEIRQYFPIEKVTDGLFQIYERIFSLRFERVHNAHVWEESVELYDVFDTATNARIGQFYLDLWPRDGKYGHAAVFGLVAGGDNLLISTDNPQSRRQLPVAAMVANFTKPTPETPSLLTHEEVVTYFHEFGHVMHQVCTRARYCRFAGTSVERDFVEAPSQMLENWCYEHEALTLMSGKSGTGDKLPQHHVDRIVAAKNANAGVLNKRQLVFGLFDQTIHSKDEADTAAVYKDVLKRVSDLDATPGTNFAAGFAHLAGGYDCGYYGYLYSQVFSADMFYTRFKSEGIMNPVVGREYREVVMAPSGSVDSMDSLVKFLGREPTMDAFLKSNGFQ